MIEPDTTIFDGLTVADVWRRIEELPPEVRRQAEQALTPEATAAVLAKALTLFGPAAAEALAAALRPIAQSVPPGAAVN